MRLDRLLNEVDVYDRPTTTRKIEITGVTERLDEVAPGSLFCCVKGASRDGHDLAAAALERGAAALLVDRELDGVGGVQVRVSEVRAALGPIAAEFYDNPARGLRIAGITGTNGKTTTAHLLASILRHHKWKTAVIGTLNGQYTTPPAILLQRMLADIRHEHNNALVMEVSSQGLEQHRVDALVFDVGVFTNLTQDHLDYHRTMQRYFDAKAMLFDPGRSEKAVVNVDDEWGRRLLDRLAVPAVEFGVRDAHDLQMGPASCHFVWEGQPVHLPMIGAFNVANALAAAYAARSMGVPPERVAEALSQVSPVPGRMERVDAGQPFGVFVDFAHTPDGLENVLRVASEAAHAHDGRVTVVFGAGGDRDADKRPQMGAVAERLADVVVVTSDNPRSEGPELIIGQIVAGMSAPERAHVVVDRRDAIAQALGHARPNDIVVIAGKGHEATQEIAGHKHPFDDRQVAFEVLQQLRLRSEGSRTGEVGR